MRRPKATSAPAPGATVGKLFGIERAMRGGLGTRVDHGRRHHGRRAGRRQRDRRRGRSGAPAASSPARAPPTAAACSARCARCGAASCRRARRAAPPAARPRSASSPPTPCSTKAEATKVAQMAHDGLARSINPVHTMSDGDIVFALATGASGRAPTHAARRARRRRARRGGAARGARRHGIGGPGLPDLPCGARPRQATRTRPETRRPTR